MLRWIARTILFLVLLIVLVLALVFALAPRIDLTPYRQTIAQQFGQSIGRETQLNGGVALQLGRHTQLMLQDLRIANPAWAQSEQLVQVGEASVGLELLDLLQGVLNVELVTLRHAKVALEVSQAGEASWEFVSEQASEQPAEPIPENDDSAGFGMTVVVQRVEIEDFELSLVDPKQAPVQLRIDHLNQYDADGMLVLDGLGRANDLDIKLVGRMGTVSSLISGRDIDLDLQLILDTTSILLRGRLGDVVRLEDIELESSIQGPSLAELLNKLHLDYQPPGDIDLILSITDLERGFAWNSQGRVGPLNVDSSGTLERPLELDDFQFDITAKGSDLSALGRLAGVKSLPVQPYSLNGKVQRNETGLELQQINIETGDTRFKLSGRLPAFPQLDNGSSVLDLEVPEPGRFAGLIGVDLSAVGPLQARVEMKPSQNKEVGVEAKLSLGSDSLTLQGKVGRYPTFSNTELAFVLAGPNTETLAKISGVSELPSEPYRLAGDLSVSDKGEVSVDLPDGQILGLKVQTKGALGRLPEMAGADLAFELSGASLAATAGPFVEADLPKLPFSVATRVQGVLTNPQIPGVTARLGDAELQVRGSQASLQALLDTKGKSAATDAEVGLELSVPSLAEFGLPDSQSQPLQMKALLKKSPQGYQLQDVLAHYGSGRIEGLASIELAQRPYVKLQATIREFDFRPFLPVAKQQTEEADSSDIQAKEESAPELADAEPSKTEQRLIPDSPLPLAFLEQFDGDFKINGEAMLFPDPAFPDKVLIREFALDANLREGNLNLRDTHLRGDRGLVALTGELKQQNGRAKLDAILQARDFRFGLLASGSGLERLPPHALDVQLSTSGHTSRQLAAALNGSIRLQGEKGETLNTGLDKALGSFLDELVSAVNPYSKAEEHTLIECTAAGVKIENGFMSLEPGLVIRTDKIDISAFGSIDLTSEAIDIKFKNSPRKGIGLSATGLVNPYVKVGGSLAEPGLALDTTSALLSGTAAVATSGISILATSLLDRVSTAANPCEAALRQVDTGEGGFTLNPIDAISNSVRGKVPSLFGKGPGASAESDESDEP